MGITNKDSSKKTDKIVRLIEYLTALARMDRKSIRDVDKYERVVWLHEIPRNPRYCFVQAWGEEDEGGEGAWITVEKFSEPKLPAPPIKCRDWIDPEALRNTKQRPELLQVISASRTEPNPETGETQEFIEARCLEDFPEVVKAWESYIDNQWSPWADLYSRYEAVSNIYSRFFQIYQDQQRLGEQYELLLSLGLLTWLTPTGYEVRRHVLSASATLDFEARPGRFTVGPSTEGAQPRVEFDMLDPEHQPENGKQLAEGTATLQDNPFDKAAVDPLLAEIAHSLPPLGKGEYQGSSLEPMVQGATEKPVVDYAPALILRKRTQGHLENVLNRIKEQLSSNENIPHGFLSLCEAVENVDAAEQEDLEHLPGLTETEIYFPLPANEEQRHIIRALGLKKEVLVQGPPGTGKSHTIANLICHFLATGRRVLVTAKTPRALKVLHDKLPQEIRPLCVSLLGHGTEERRSMERSVAGILVKHGARDKTKVQETIRRLERGIRENREAKIQTDHKVVGFRERETERHSVADGVYQGTAAAIAQRLNKEKEQFYWFEDHVASDDVLPVTETELNWLSRMFEIDGDNDAESLLKQFIPDPEQDLPSLDKVRDLFQHAQVAPRKDDAASERLESPAGRSLKQATNDDIEKLKLELERLAAEAKTMSHKPAAWIGRSVKEVLGGSDASWRELLSLSRTESRGLRELAERMRTHEITIPHRMEREQLIQDAKAIRDHLKEGGKLNGWFGKPRIVKDHGQFLETVKVNGLPCSDPQTLEILIDYIELEQRLKRVWGRWRGKCPQPVESPLVQIAKMEELHEQLDALLGLCDLRERAAQCIGRVSGLVGPRWDDDASLTELVATCQAVQEHRVRVSIVKQFREMETAISLHAAKDNVHPIACEFLDAFKRRDIERYSRLVDQALELRRKAELMIRKNEIVDKLFRATPRLISSLNQAGDNGLWVQRLRDLNGAWAWARVKTWLNEFLVTNYESLERNSARLGEEIRDHLSELAALKAWDFCLERMKPHHKGHLVAWQQAMEKYGKGKGKHAHVHLHAAQEHLNQCRDAVPAWIMPLHRVYETVQADARIFDLIIVDEASQCGPEALSLLYLGERILIVGDDKQISPEAIGVPKKKVFKLIEEYLPDFHHHDAFDKETSLFDHGKRRFGDPISLREHFRCMPEIIYFSNDLCYRESPLVPLRQYPPDRLRPIKVDCVPQGYREGYGQRVINRPEAEALADAVAGCCNDPRYNGRTMGVIVLQGEAQAAIIEDLLLKRIGAEQMAQRRLVCGNPYSFQGDERHIIFLSMVAADNEKIGVLNKKPDVRRFNVAASRARDQMWLFHSDIYNRLGQDCLRRQLLDYFYNPTSRITKTLGENADELQEKAFRANRMIEEAPKPFDSWFEVDVALHIANRGYRVIPQFEFGGKKIDLVVQGGQRQLAVECYGDHWHSGEENYRADMVRQRKLERCGWRFFIVRESFYRAAPEEALKSLWEMLDRMGIYTVSSALTERSARQNHDSRGKQCPTEPDFEQKLQNKSDEEQEETSPESVPVSGPIDRVGGDGGPKTIQDALRERRELISKAIIIILQERPNNSCKKDNMPAYILSRWGIRTRGTPRKQFEKKVDDAIAIMERAGHIEVYKATNVRIRLGCVPYPGVNDT